MKLVVGCPLRRREWVIDRWLEHVEAATVGTVVDDFDVVVVADPADPTLDKLTSLHERLHLVPCDEDVAAEDKRDWRTAGRFARMAELRNQLLGKVRELGPDLFLSLDSDILIHPQAITTMIAMLETGKYDAVGSKAFLSPFEKVPNYATISGFGTLLRSNATGTFKVHVLMAIKLMTPKAYAVDYGHDPRGEDIFWSKSARSAGVRLGWTGSVTSTHVMSPDKQPEAL